MFLTASKCILLETPNEDISLPLADALCQNFCNGPSEEVFTVNDNNSGFANFCRANNACTVKKCPVKLKT